MLQGRHAIVTGGSRGIGAAAALELARLGANVTLMGRDRITLDAHATVVASAHGVETAAVPCDVASDASVAEAFRVARETLGVPYALVTSAGQADAAPFTKTTRALWDRLLSVNLTGAFLCMQQVLPAMLEAGEGRVVNVASMAGLKAYRDVAAYTASKHGLIGLTRAAALEAAPRGVTVNAVCPGYVDTDMATQAVANIMAKGRTEAEARALIAKQNPRGTLITVAEVAATIGWLCTPAASGVNGEALEIAGGEQ